MSTRKPAWWPWRPWMWADHAWTHVPSGGAVWLTDDGDYAYATALRGSAIRGRAATAEKAKRALLRELRRQPPRIKKLRRRAT